MTKQIKFSTFVEKNNVAYHFGARIDNKPIASEDAIKLLRNLIKQSFLLLNLHSPKYGAQLPCCIVWIMRLKVLSASF